MGITTGTGFAHKIVLDDAGTPVDYIDLFSTKLPEEIKYLGEFGRAALYGESRNLEYYSQPLNRWYSVFLFNDQHLCFTTIYHDITDTKNALEELQNAEMAEKCVGGGTIGGFVKLKKEDVINIYRLAE